MSLQPRLSLRTSLILVAIAALDLAAIRAVFGLSMPYGSGVQAIIQTWPMGLLVNLATLMLIVGRGRSRAFWAGFLVGGLLMMTTSAWAALTPAGYFRPVPGSPNVILEGSMMWHLWADYFALVRRGLEIVGLDLIRFSPRSLDDPGVGYIAIVGLMAFAPELVVALVAGGIAVVIHRAVRGSLAPESGRPSSRSGESLGSSDSRNPSSTLSSSAGDVR